MSDLPLWTFKTACSYFILLVTVTIGCVCHVNHAGVKLFSIEFSNHFHLAVVLET